jgi:hypothetical protein
MAAFRMLSRTSMATTFSWDPSISSNASTLGLRRNALHLVNADIPTGGIGISVNDGAATVSNNLIFIGAQALAVGIEVSASARYTMAFNSVVLSAMTGSCSALHADQTEPNSRNKQISSPSVCGETRDCNEQHDPCLGHRAKHRH